MIVNHHQYSHFIFPLLIFSTRQIWTIHHLILSSFSFKDGSGWDPDARWLLCRRHMGAEDACHRSAQGRVAKGHRGNPYWWSYAQTGGKIRYAFTILSADWFQGTSMEWAHEGRTYSMWLVKAVYHELFLLQMSSIEKHNSLLCCAACTVSVLSKADLRYLLFVGYK